ncbi:hypothetical protein NQ176_g4783 [Zarea fungicola]|uniref:Uncharacterized protein n=1 Tax=Zarea fungicola TaxID=93591 RepID=A0ACC1NDZ0_9HYPO|nr:hypothetical protein NQ176_g4783 [Lecanicillium fungicola]
MRPSTVILGCFLPAAFSIPVGDLDGKTSLVEARADDPACLACLFKLAQQGFSSTFAWGFCASVCTIEAFCQAR